MKHKPPGKIKSGAEHDVVMMICTAGHVDHGKTSLVKQLTGCNTDRLRAEKERGLTIELGFAPCMLQGNISVGIVDVPGHEKFVKNMVSGVPGIDLAILVIAADDGIMPQTIEHFQIMELLGVRSGIVALTKIDLASEDRRNRLSEEINGFLKGSFMEGAPICPVSSQTFEGYFDFYDCLVEQIKNLKKKRAFGVFRMPIERTFSQAGFGSILSGLVLDGKVSVGDQVELVPGGNRGKIRGIQCFAQTAKSGGYGQCLALNIPDFGKIQPERGQVLCVPGYLKASRYFHVRLKTIPGMERPLKNAEEIKFHTGTSEMPGKIFFLEGSTMGGGETGLATVALSSPVAAAALDKFILRRFSPQTTVAGGEVLAVSHSERRPRKKRIAEQLKAYQSFFEGIDVSSEEGAEKRIEYFLCAEEKTGAPSKAISIGTLLPMEIVKQSLVRLTEEGKVLVIGSAGLIQAEGGKDLQGDFFIHKDSYDDCLNEIEEWIKETAAKESALSISIADLRKKFEWPPLLWNTFIKALDQGSLVTVQRNKLILKEAENKFDDEDRLLMENLFEIYDKSAFRSPRPDELPRKLNAPMQKIDYFIEHLCNELKLVRLSKNVVLSYSMYKNAQDKAVEIIKEKGVVNSADFKYVIDSTRKYALAILDFMDDRRITVCMPNHDRKLAADYERNLL